MLHRPLQHNVISLSSPCILYVCRFVLTLPVHTKTVLITINSVSPISIYVIIAKALPKDCDCLERKLVGLEKETSQFDAWKQRRRAKSRENKTNKLTVRKIWMTKRSGQHILRWLVCRNWTTTYTNSYTTLVWVTSHKNWLIDGENLRISPRLATVDWKRID